jgi:hypothetical protein
MQQGTYDGLWRGKWAFEIGAPRESRGRETVVLGLAGAAVHVYLDLVILIGLGRVWGLRDAVTVHVL